MLVECICIVDCNIQMLKKEESLESHQSSSPSPSINNGQSTLQHVLDAVISYITMPNTIQADATTHPKFIKMHLKIAAILLLTMYLLRVLPQPLIIVQQAGISKGQQCNTTQIQCKSFEGNTQQISIKKVNPFNRELKLFVEIDYDLLPQMQSIVKEGIDHPMIPAQVLSISLYSMRNNEIHNDPLDSYDGDDLYEVIFNGQPMLYAGEVHILNDGAYLMRIQKKQYDIITLNSNNQTIVQTYSIPLIITSVMYSQFYTVLQLVIRYGTVMDIQGNQIIYQRYIQNPIHRYITLLLILYCIAETSSSPPMLHTLLILISNPLIFTEVAFPNTGSNILSSLCASSYILYAGIYMGYTDREGTYPIVRRIVKGIGVIAVYIVNVISMQHIANKTLIYILQSTLIILLLLPLCHYLWRVYFVEQQRILHRDAVFIMLTCYYFSFLFFSGYIVEYGWQKIVYFIIIQTYGVNLCYLTKRYHWRCQPKENSPVLSAGIKQGEEQRQRQENHHKSNHTQIEMQRKEQFTNVEFHDDHL